MGVKMRDPSVQSLDRPDGGVFESRLSLMKLRRRRMRARLFAGELGWVLLLAFLTVLVLAQLGPLGRG